jgi:EAL domain-containing protein (putative c-di-GMP-specific phosphodiesterase class I)/CheY-like chemotaxis protein
MKNAADIGSDRTGNIPAAGEAREDVRALIIDDDQYVRSMIGRLLARLGVTEVCQAADGREGARAIEGAARVFDLTVVDIDMPNSDGMEFLRLMGQRNYAGPVMILSGKPAALLNSVQIMAQEYGLNVLGVAQKPPSIGLLKQALNSCRSVTLPKRAAVRSSYPPEEILAALEKHEFEPFFQPKVEIATRQLRGCEALARWRHPRDGIIAPGAFIAVIEEAKCMDELTRLMLGQAATWCRRWRDAGLTLTVSVNLSMSSLSDNNMADRTADVVRAAGVEPRDVVLEITETLAMTEILRCLESLCRLRLRGFGLSIDDFGTGFSSLQQLTRVPYTELKIDQGFVNGAVASAERRTVLESSIDMAKKLGLSSVAEGVETQEDWQLLHALGCDLAQGYFIAKPLSGEEFTTWAVSKGQSSAE